MQRSFRAAVLEECGRPLAIRELQIPELGASQVLINVRYSGVCRSQLMEARGMRGDDPWLPHLLGHEGVGTVVETGPGVTKVSPGQVVIIGWIQSSGLTSANPIFMSGDVRINAGAATTFSEMTVVSENRVYAKPEGVSDKAAVLFGCALLTGAGMVLNELPPRETDNIIVMGLGGVGMAAVIGALTAQPAMVIAVDISPEKRALALELGADIALDSWDPEFVDHIRDLTDGGADACFECAGTTATIELALDCVRPAGGTVLFASHPPAGDRIRVDPFHLISGKKLLGSWGGGAKPDSDIPRMAAAIRGRGIDLEVLVSDEYALEEVNQALDDMEAGRTIRPLLGLDELCASDTPDFSAGNGVLMAMGDGRIDQ
ncbi:MAG: zinc-binding dehydrogenase [Actinobacteria bacterium]|nr:zinc-binding dehydrogenase [Actinomycetota bacterium]